MAAEYRPAVVSACCRQETLLPGTADAERPLGHDAALLIGGRPDVGNGVGGGSGGNRGGRRVGDGGGAGTVVSTASVEDGVTSTAGAAVAGTESSADAAGFAAAATDR